MTIAVIYLILPIGNFISVCLIMYFTSKRLSLQWDMTMLLKDDIKRLRKEVKERKR